MTNKLSRSPETIIAAVTGRCNLACKYCFYADEMAALDDLPSERWLGFFRECGEAGVTRIVLSGGELFTRKDIWELMDAVVGNRMRFGILTNATLITDRTAARLEEYNRRLDTIQVSVDGSGSDTHDRIRGRGSFDRVMAGIGSLKKYGLPWTVRVTINKLNVYDLEDILDLPSSPCIF